MASGLKKMSWFELISGLLVSPRHTAWEFSQQEDVIKKAWILVVIAVIVECISQATAVIYIHRYYPELDETALSFSILIVLILSFLTLMFYPLTKWIVRLVLKLDKIIDAKNISAYASSTLGMIIFLSPALLFYDVVFASRSARKSSIPIETYDTLTLYGIGIYTILSVIIAAFYLDGIFQKGFLRSLGISFILSVLLFIIIFIVASPFIFYLFWFFEGVGV